MLLTEDAVSPEQEVRHKQSTKLIYLRNDFIIQSTLSVYYILPYFLPNGNKIQLFYILETTYKQSVVELYICL